MEGEGGHRCAVAGHKGPMAAYSVDTMARLSALCTSACALVRRPYLSALAIANRHCSICARVVSRSWLMLLLRLRGLLAPLLLLLV